MGVRYEWENAELDLGWSYPGDEDFTDSDELTKPALILGGGTGAGLVIQDSKENLIEMAKRILRLAMGIDWTPIDRHINLGDRTNEVGYVDSIALIKDTIIGTMDETTSAGLEKANAVRHRFDLNLIEISGSGYDLDTMVDTLTEWEELAEEYDLSAYADSEAGVYRVTNLPSED